MKEFFTFYLYHYFFFQTRLVSFKLFIPGDRGKVLNVDVYIERWKEMEKLSMKNITDSNLWEGNLIVPCSQQFTRYYFSIKVDASFYVNFAFVKKLRIFEKTKVYKTEDFKCRRESSLEIQLALCNKTEKEEGYFSLCYNILKCATSGQELECMTQMKQMEDISAFLDKKQREEILRRMIRGMQKEKLTKSLNCAVFLSFLLHAHISLDLKGIMPYQFAKTIINGFSSINVGYIPKAQQGAFIDVLKKVYICADREYANYFSFCNYMYPCFGAVICCELLSCWKSPQKDFDYLMPQDDKKGKRILKSLVDAICRQWGSIKEERFLCEIQQSLSLKMQTKLIEFFSNEVVLPTTATDILQLTCENELDVKSKKGEIYLELFSNEVDLPVTAKTILESTCEKELQEVTAKGEIIDIITKWYEISNCSLLDTDEIREMTEKCLLKCIDKANESQIENSYDKLKDLCLFGKLFIKNSKSQLLRTFFTSVNYRIHSLVPLLLKEKRYQDISKDDMDNIVLRWFYHALSHFCIFTSKGNDLPASLCKLYTYVADIMGIACLQTNKRLLTKLKKKAFEYLKNIDIVEVVKAGPYMERLDCLLTEDIFREHMRTLFKGALENQDISRHDLFCQTKTCAVNHR